MVRWSRINKGTINRVGYNKEVKSLYVDFIGSDVDTAFINVPEALYVFFVEAKFPDYFFRSFVDGYFEEAKLRLENNINSIYPYAV